MGDRNGDNIVNSILSFFLSAGGAVASALVLLEALGFPDVASAQTYPSRPIRLIVGFPPGGAADILGRHAAQQLTEALGQQVVVDNRPGASGTLGHDIGAKATPDGYTIGYAPVGALAISPNLVKKLSYDVLKDFQPLAQIASNQMLLAASPSLPQKTVREVVDYAKRNPGKLLNASSGIPAPVSATLMVTCPWSYSVWRNRSPPVGMASMALLTRFSRQL